MKRLAVLISNKGMGTNLQAIIDAQEAGKLNAQIVVVISDTEEAYGIKRARSYNLKVEICPNKEDLLTLLKKYEPDFIVLAGWKQIIEDEVIIAFPNKILNVHPGLIPDTLDGSVTSPDGSKALWNRGLLAQKAIKNFLDNKATYAGSTVHFLSKEFDFGPVLAHAFVKINKKDMINSLYERLKAAEHKIYVQSLQKLCGIK